MQILKRWLQIDQSTMLPASDIKFRRMKNSRYIYCAFLLFVYLLSTCPYHFIFIWDTAFVISVNYSLGRLASCVRNYISKIYSKSKLNAYFEMLLDMAIAPKYIFLFLLSIHLFATCSYDLIHILYTAFVICVNYSFGCSWSCVRKFGSRFWCNKA